LGGGQLVFVPEFGGQLVVLPFGGAFALRQAGHFPAGVLPVFGGGAGGGLGFGLGGLPLHPAAGGGLDGRLLFPDGVAAAPGLVLHFLDGPEDLPIPGLQVADGGGQAVLMGAGVGQALLPVRDAAAAELGVLLAGQLVHPFLGQRVGQLGLTGGEAVPALGQAGQLGGQGAGLGLEGGPGLGRLFRGLGLSPGFGGQGAGFGGTLAGGFLRLADRLLQAPALGFGPDAVAGCGALLAFGGGQLGGHGVGLALALGGAQPGGGTVPGQARDLVL